MQSLPTEILHYIAGFVPGSDGVLSQMCWNLRDRCSRKIGIKYILQHDNLMEYFQPQMEQFLFTSDLSDDIIVMLHTSHKDLYDALMYAYAKYDIPRLPQLPTKYDHKSLSRYVDVAARYGSFEFIKKAIEVCWEIRLYMKKFIKTARRHNPDDKIIQFIISVTNSVSRRSDPVFGIINKILRDSIIKDNIGLFFTLTSMLVLNRAFDHNIYSICARCAIDNGSTQILKYLLKKVFTDRMPTYFIIADIKPRMINCKNRQEVVEILLEYNMIDSELATKVTEMERLSDLRAEFRDN